MAASNSKSNSDSKEDPLPSESQSSELSSLIEHFTSTAINKGPKTSQSAGVRKGKQNSAHGSKGARKGNNTRGVKAKVKEPKQHHNEPKQHHNEPKQHHNEPKNRNLNVMRKIMSTFKRTSDHKRIVIKYAAPDGLVVARERENDDTSAGTKSQQSATVISPPDFNYQLQSPPEEETDEELEEEDQGDYDNIDPENIRIPLKTIAINELLFPQGRFGRKWANQKRKKNSEMNPKPSNTSSSTKTTSEDPNVTSYYDWDDGLDTLSVRTEDIFTNGGELVPNFNSRTVHDNSGTLTDPSSGSAAASFPKSKISKIQTNSAPIRVVHSHVITPFRLNKTNWNVA
ncbi:unnamed protein product [Allacma fusca]|uniref:Uncharacterized protein n=1 Tax=Allacma fusca TaxID=39272 RepID=A0A8J2LGM5_9HEXA|nr:unnamed protein product [Allacma fusca]